MMVRSKKGFTLVELMVVMAIIGILAAALITPISNIRQTARSVRCKTNLRNLAQAAHTFAGEGEGERRRLPAAGTYERLADVGRESDGRLQYTVHTGWVTGYNEGGVLRWPVYGTPQLARGNDERASYPFFGDSRAVHQAITNGVLWKYVGGDLSTYVCDEHKAVAKRAGCKNVLRSYVMNAYFGCNFATEPKDSLIPHDREWSREISHLASGKASLMLLFAELPAYDAAGKESVDTGAGKTDGVLDTLIPGFNRPGTEEMIGFNHRLVKRRIAHVVFVDGHVDAIVAPDNASDSDLKDLTALLCNGLEVSADMSDWTKDRPKK